MLVINDLHAGTVRAGGTTPVSRALLTEYIFEQTQRLIDLCANEELLINGDLFDSFLVDNRTVREVAHILGRGLASDKITKLYLSRGNHDVSKDSTKLSSFDLLGFMLTEMHPGRVIVITEPTTITWAGGSGLVLPHAPNQDVFDLWLQRAPQLAGQGRILFVHANYDNDFAVEADHSLNVSKEQAGALSEYFDWIIFGHEHQARSSRENNVLVLGNQFPVSISDCLGNDMKNALRITGRNIAHPVQTWTSSGSFFQVAWNATHTVPEGVKFIRVVGQADDDQVSEVLEAISRLRKAHSAFVVGNAVEVDGKAMDASALDALDEVQRFDVLEMIYANLKAAQIERLNGYVADKEKDND